MKRTKLTGKEVKNIISLYNDNVLSVKKIAKKTGYSTSLIARVLQENEVYRYSEKVLPKQKQKTPKKGFKFVAECNKTGKVFDDHKNSSGVLTIHIRKIYPNIDIPSGFKRRQYKMKTGKYWFEDFITIKEVQLQKKQTKKCEYCNWQTNDIENRSGAYTIHLRKNHNLSVDKHLKKYPKDKEYFSTFKRRRKKKRDLLTKKGTQYITCNICNTKLKTLTNSHLKKHGITLVEYKLGFPKQKYHSEDFVNKTKENLKKVNVNAQRKFISKPEISLVNFLKSLGLEVHQSNRKLLSGVEIDIINNDRKIGIEFNGCKYHTELYGGKDRSFHLKKTKLMNMKGYGLIHIFEDEWELRNKIVKSKLKHIFNINYETIPIHARKCEIKEISSKEKNQFLERYHIQGKDKSNIYIGAFSNNKLLAVMTFDNKRSMTAKKNEKGKLELRRFVVHNNYRIPGIASKMLSYFIKKYKPIKIISFADRRWTLSKENNLYTKLGFKLTKTLGPDYFYHNTKLHRLRRFYKFGFGKKSLKRKYPEIYDDDKTEWEMMQGLGFDRIWDCGKFRYELDL